MGMSKGGLTRIFSLVITSKNGYNCIHYKNNTSSLYEWCWVSSVSLFGICHQLVASCLWVMQVMNSETCLFSYLLLFFVVLVAVIVHSCWYSCCYCCCCCCWESYTQYLYIYTFWTKWASVEHSCMPCIKKYHAFTSTVPCSNRGSVCMSIVVFMHTHSTRNCLNYSWR